MSDIAALARSTRFAFWKQDWNDIAAPITRLELRPDQMRWLNSLRDPFTARPVEDSGLIAELLDLTVDGHAYRIWVGDLTSGRGLTGLSPDRNLALQNLIGVPWLSVQTAVRDALTHGYALHLNLVDEGQYPISTWWRCLLRNRKIERILPASRAPDLSERDACSALLGIAERLQSGAPAAAVVVDIALSAKEKVVSAGLLSAAPAPESADLGLEFLRESTGIAEVAPTCGQKGLLSDDFWVTMLP